MHAQCACKACSADAAVPFSSKSQQVCSASIVIGRCMITAVRLRSGCSTCLFAKDWFVQPRIPLQALLVQRLLCAYHLLCVQVV
jgi:hypothetical protein